MQFTYNEALQLMPASAATTELRRYTAVSSYFGQAK